MVWRESLITFVTSTIYEFRKNVTIALCIHLIRNVPNVETECGRRWIKYVRSLWHNPQALLESEKIPTFSISLTLTKVRRDPRVTLRKFSPDTTGHGLRITKLPAVWYFHISLWKIPISFGSIFSFLYNPQALLESEKIWTLSFSPTFGFFWTKFWIL